MTSYQLTLKIGSSSAVDSTIVANVVQLGQKSLRILAQGQYSLCFASAVSDGISSENLNVVALTVPSEGMPSNSIRSYWIHSSWISSGSY